MNAFHKKISLNYLDDQTLSIKEIALELNFDSAFYLSPLFKEKAGVSPETYRQTTRSKR